MWQAGYCALWDRGTLILSELTDILVSREKVWILFSLRARHQAGFDEAAVAFFSYDQVVQDS